MCQSAWRRRTALACVRTALALTALTLFLSCTSWAQLPQAGDTTSPPTPGVGHDYIHSPVETVNPANGSVSIRIPVRISSGRELTIPFNIAYDSSGAFYYGSQGNTPGLLTVTGVPFSQGGWSYTFPLATNAEIDWDHPGVNGGRDYPCTESANYVFQDPSGSRHNLGLLWAPKGPGGQECGSSILTGGEGPILATASSGDGSTTLTDGNGTVYSFPANNGVGGLPTGITDRNGNTVTISSTPTSATVTDTAGRAAISVGSFGGAPDNINVAGTLSPYQVFWTTASANYSINVVNLDPNFDPNCGTSLSGSVKAVSEIVLPNGQKYTFSYNSFGMLSEITYPSGGHVRYVWGLHNSSSLPEAGFWTDGTTAYTCLYDVPTIADRYVSFDGTTEPLHQQFSYSTSWQSGSDEYTSKTTTVTTTDSVTGTSFKTVYTYTAVLAPNVPMGEARSGSEQTVQIPVEQTVQYDGTNGSPIKTVGKTWCNVRELCSETTTLNDTNQVSEVTYSYNTNEQQTEKDEYDYGSGAHGPLLRKTVTSYASFTGAHIVDLPSGVITYDGSGNRAAETDSSYDQTGLQTTSVVQHGSAGTARGNLTTVTKDCFVGSTTCASGNATTTYSYYDTGQIYQMTDPKLNVTTFSYTDSYSSCGGNAPPAGATNAYLTQVTYPQTGTVSHVESYCYDYSAGLLRGSTDQNGQTSTYTYADSLDRLTLANYPDGGQTIVSYNDAGPTPSVTTEKKLDTSGRFVTTVNFTNGMGLPIETELTSDPQGTDLTVTSYDGLGRAHTVTNPYRSTSDPTYGLTTYSYDALGRTLSVQKPDGSTVSTSYSGNCTTVTDEAGKNRESCTDGLGRMTEVIENPGGLGYMTNYTYDTLDDLTSVVQGGSRNRSFAYDSLKRMTQSVNPESGTINYIYDANGNVSTKTDNRSITTAYSYDALNRVTGMTYSNGDPAVSYTYDQSACLGQSACYNIGHRTTVTDAGGNEEFAYDKAGREIAEQRTTSGHTKSTSYGYDLAGDMTSLVYPSGRTITYTYDSAGRPSDAVDTANSINYEVGPCTNGASTSPTTGVCYAPNGAVTQEQNGTNLVTTYIYNKRFQPCWMYGTTGSPLATSTTCTAADPGPGNILDLQYNFNLGAGDNGNVVGITNNRDTTRSESFTYDALNRIATGQTGATSGANCWGQSYTIDQWGNLTNIGHVSGYSACSQGSLSVSALTNNQLSSTGFSYDGAGNMTNDGANAYTYNAESETTSAAGVTYTYDGDGNRVEKANGRLFWYGAGTEILDESDLTGSITLEMVYFGGKRVAHRTSSNVIYYYEGDMLGSARSIVQAGATAVCYDADFLPFGGERDIVNTCSQNYKFEGKKRDLETGNDDFGARYYRSNLGRWMSADWSSVPAPVPYANLTNPQTLNLYAMVSDNPETFADLDGHDNNCTYGPLGQESCKSTANSNANAPATTGEGHSQPDPQKNGTNTPNSTTDQVLQVAKEAVDWFNNNLGFANGKSTCASGGSCANAVGMAATTVLATVASDGGSAAGKAPAIEELIAKSAQAIENHAQELTEETLARASSEVNGGMKVAKVGGGEFSHAAKVEQRMNGLNRQARHLERLLGRSGLSESHIQTINGLIERAAGLAARALQAITPRQPI